MNINNIKPTTEHDGPIEEYEGNDPGWIVKKLAMVEGDRNRIAPHQVTILRKLERDAKVQDFKARIALLAEMKANKRERSLAKLKERLSKFDEDQRREKIPLIAADIDQRIHEQKAMLKRLKTGGNAMREELAVKLEALERDIKEKEITISALEGQRTYINDHLASIADRFLCPDCKKHFAGQRDLENHFKKICPESKEGKERARLAADALKKKREENKRRKAEGLKPKEACPHCDNEYVDLDKHLSHCKELKRKQKLESDEAARAEAEKQRKIKEEQEAMAMVEAEEKARQEAEAKAEAIKIANAKKMLEMQKRLEEAEAKAAELAKELEGKPSPEPPETEGEEPRPT